MFFKFSEREFNTEVLFFLQEVNDLEQIAFPERQGESVTLANHIFETYIQSTASQSPAKKRLCTLYKNSGQLDNEEKWILTSTFPVPSLAFADLKSSSMLELQSDSFPRYNVAILTILQRFLRSKLWLDFIAKQDKTFVQTYAVPKASLVHEYMNDDFGENAIVTDVDFQFAESISQDDYVHCIQVLILYSQDWSLQAHTKMDNNCFVSAYAGGKNYLPFVEWAKSGSATKFVGVLPYPMEFVARSVCCLEALATYEDTVAKTESIQFISNQELQVKYAEQVKVSHRGMGYQQVDVKFPFPVNQTRRSMQVVSAKYDPHMNRVTYIQKSCIFKDRPLPKNWIDMHAFIVFQFTHLDENRSMFSQTVLFNIHGWSNPSITKLTVAYRSKIVASTFIKFLQDEVEGKHKHFKKDDALAKCYAECDVVNRMPKQNTPINESK